MVRVDPGAVVASKTEQHETALTEHFCKLLDVYRVPESGIEVVQAIASACVEQALTVVSENAIIPMDVVTEQARDAALPKKFQKVKGVKRYLESVAGNIVRDNEVIHIHACESVRTYILLCREPRQLQKTLEHQPNQLTSTGLVWWM